PPFRSEGLNHFNVSQLDLGQQLVGDFRITLGQQYASGRMHHVVGQHLAEQVAARYGQIRHTGLFQLANMTRSNTAAFLYQDVAFLVLAIEGGNVTLPAARYQFVKVFVTKQGELAGFKEHVQDLFRGVSQSTQQNSGRQLTATVDPAKDVVFGVELKVKPGTTVGNTPRGVE